MTILELREKRNTAWNAAKAFLDSHRTEKGTLTAEDDATYSRMEQEIADLGKEIARLERQEALEAELNKPVNKPLTSKPVTAAEKPAKTGRASDEYKTGMLQALRTNFRQVSNILQEGVDADGGYLVPEEYDHRLIDVLNEENIMDSYQRYHFRLLPRNRRQTECAGISVHRYRGCIKNSLGWILSDSRSYL